MLVSMIEKDNELRQVYIAKLYVMEKKKENVLSQLSL